MLMSLPLNELDLEVIQSQAGHNFTATRNNVFAFQVMMVDNDIDASGERFTIEALETMAQISIGKMCIITDDTYGRIYACKIISDDIKKTKDGNDYFKLVARVWLPLEKLAKDEVAKRLDIGTEYSIGCSTSKSTCSICGNKFGACRHNVFENYNGQICCCELSDVTDVYEVAAICNPQNISTHKESDDSKYYSYVGNCYIFADPISSEISLWQILEYKPNEKCFEVEHRYIRNDKLCSENIKAALDAFDECCIRTSRAFFDSFGKPIEKTVIPPRMYNCKIKRLYPPKNFIPYNIGEGYKDSIDIDQCLEDEIKSLWDKGIKTTGCCCGHGRDLGFIQVTEDCINKMYELGYQNYIYEEEFGGTERKDAFIPKTTKHNYDIYRDGFWC